MKEMTLTRACCRIIEALVSQRRERFKPRDQDTWRDIAKVFIQAGGEYDRQAQALDDRSERIAGDPSLSDAERVREQGAIQFAMRELDDGLGAETTNVILEPDAFNFVKQRWQDVDLPGTRRWTAWGLIIKDAFEKPRELTISPDHKVEVKEPAVVA